VAIQKVTVLRMTVLVLAGALIFKAGGCSKSQNAGKPADGLRAEVTTTTIAPTVTTPIPTTITAAPTTTVPVSAGSVLPTPPATRAPSAGDNSVNQDFFANCDEARAAGAAPLRRGDPRYLRTLDSDRDGVACE
jgi:Excalibur calcium-binding domain